MTQLIRRWFCRHTYGPFVSNIKLEPRTEIEEVPALRMSRKVLIQEDVGHAVCTKCGFSKSCYVKNYLPFPEDAFENSKPSAAEKAFSDSILPRSIK